MIDKLIADHHDVPLDGLELRIDEVAKKIATQSRLTERTWQRRDEQSPLWIGSRIRNMKTTIIAAASAAILLAATSAVFAQQGTTLAGPAQGSKANGESSTAPSESGANSGTMTRGGAMTGRSDSAAPGAPADRLRRHDDALI